MPQALNLHITPPMLPPGITVHTSPPDAWPIETMQLTRFNGTRYECFDGLFGGGGKWAMRCWGAGLARLHAQAHGSS